MPRRGTRRSGAAGRRTRSSEGARDATGGRADRGPRGSPARRTSCGQPGPGSPHVCCARHAGICHAGAACPPSALHGILPLRRSLSGPGCCARSAPCARMRSARRASRWPSCRAAWRCARRTRRARWGRAGAAGSPGPHANGVESSIRCGSRGRLRRVACMWRAAARKTRWLRSPAAAQEAARVSLAAELAARDGELRALAAANTRLDYALQVWRGWRVGHADRGGPACRLPSACASAALCRWAPRMWCRGVPPCRRLGRGVPRGGCLGAASHPCCRGPAPPAPRSRYTATCRARRWWQSNAWAAQGEARGLEAAPACSMSGAAVVLGASRSWRPSSRRTCPGGRRPRCAPAAAGRRGWLAGGWLDVQITCGGRTPD